MIGEVVSFCFQVVTVIGMFLLGWWMGRRQERLQWHAWFDESDPWRAYKRTREEIAEAGGWYHSGRDD